MIAGALIILGSYLAYIPWIYTAFTVPKMVFVAFGAAWATIHKPYGSPVAALRWGFYAIMGATALSALAADSPILAVVGRGNSSAVGLMGVAATWLCYEAGTQDSGHGDQWLVWGSVLCAIAGFLQLVFGWFLVAPLPGVTPRVYGLAGSPPFLGCMLALALPIVWKQGWLVRAVLIAAILATKSRSGILGATAGVSVLLLGIPRSVLVGVLTLSVGAFASFFFHGRSEGDGNRIQAWGIAVRIFLEQPFFGCGPEGFTDYFMLLRKKMEWNPNPAMVFGDAHNLILHILASGGLIGVAAWTYLVKIARTRGASHPIIASTAAIFIYGMFNPIPFMAVCVLGYFWGVDEKTN